MDFALDEMTVAELQASMAAGEQTSRSIVAGYLDRIEAANTQGPELRAIIETNPAALEVAEALDAERLRSGPRGPLHGIPVVLKDNIDTADAMTTTAGSLALEGSIPSRDAFVVERLRAAGAVILAKANMSEWAFFRGEHATSGWSARGGQCRNPYALDRNPCGSSSGSAVAVAANLAALAVGTETNGSIMCPSSINGIVGIKPTVGLCSRSGVIPISHSQDTVGPMARTVADAAVLLGALAGIDERDEATTESADRAHVDYTRFLDPTGLNGARIGAARNISGFRPETDQLFEAAIEVMRSAGATIETTDIEHAGWKDPNALLVLEYEFKAGLDRYLADLGSGAPVKSLADVIEFNERHADREMPHFGQQRLLSSQARGPLTDPAYVDALQRIRQANRTDGIDAAMHAHQLDAIIAPSTDPAWLTDHQNGDHRGGGSSAGPAAIAGYPNVSVPMGQVDGLPVGISFFGRAWSEPTLITIAHAFEQATRHRTRPDFRRVSR